MRRGRRRRQSAGMLRKALSRLATDVAQEFAKRELFDKPTALTNQLVRVHKRSSADTKQVAAAATMSRNTRHRTRRRTRHRK